MLTAHKRIQRLFKHIPVDQALAQKPAGKRSVAMAQRGSVQHHCYGNRKSHCVATNKGVQKRSR
ncbi:MAG: hypothetical protein LOD88_10845 [Novibacillus thermophilus]|uniref:Uncharacterized protein n=1 Tax=Novibacillus thermophilus TaxID=1471761 RepID=A0A1U9K418_9BACL|nr:hypothetical protein [Novibacillus thermophilus]AQS54773.1 hypothetical protein B0W44_02300 [Novibacillus thermophilus]